MRPASVPDALRRGALLLAASPRLAADWRRRLVATAPGVVATPAVEAWAPWLTGLARGLPLLPVPYTELQELQLWERVIAADLGGEVAGPGLARHAREAYRLMCEYRIDAGELAGNGEEAEALGRWIAAMRKAAQAQGRMFSADLPATLLPHADALAAVPAMLLDGFHEATPMQRALLEALRAKGVRMETVAGDGVPVTPGLTACVDVEDECRHVAARIAAIIEAKPAARIGVVTVGQVPPMLGRMLDEALLPPGAPAVQAVAMTGAPLAARPVVRQLLGVLALAGGRGAAHAELAPLLFSPGLRGHGEEGMGRARLDARLREGNRHYLSFRALQGMAVDGDMPGLAAAVQQLATWDMAGRTAGEWVGAVHALLQALGFLQADRAGRGDEEVRELNAFRECLASLVAVDAVRGRLEWREFASLLSQACHETAYAPPVLLPQVSVLPLPQVTGLRFDVVFAMGCDDEALPMPAQPFPLLPFSLQRRHALPGTTAALAFASAEACWGQLRCAAPAVHASYAVGGDGRERMPSPFLAGLAADAPPATTPAPEALAVEAWEDAPMVPMERDAQLRGGSAVIRNQSACPFRAFATHRLDVQPLGETEPGIQPTEKGSLIHHALEFIWERLGTQQALLALDDEAQAALIDGAVDHAWEQARVTVAEATEGFERRRMALVLAAWLGEEKGRPGFTVECCEKGYRLELPSSGELRFPVTLKADRIDRDGDGHRILIDYKTGAKQAVGKWVGARMAEPQLPLYAVAEGLGEADAVCFARVRSGDMGFEGLSGEPTGIRGVTVYKGRDEEAEDWPALLARWRERIDALAAEFVAGRCDVTPRDAHACDYCGLEAVCRIDEIGIDRDADEEDPA